MGDLNEYGFRFNRGIPPRALTLDLAHQSANRTRKSSRLVLGVGELPANFLRALRRRGAEVRCVRDADEALEACQRTTFDALVCIPSSGVTSLVRLLKHAPSRESRSFGETFPGTGACPPTAHLSADEVNNLHRRFEFVPIFLFKPLLPEEYAVLIRPPSAAYEEASSELALDIAIMRLDARAMFSSMEPLA